MRVGGAGFREKDIGWVVMGYSCSVRIDGLCLDLLCRGVWLNMRRLCSS